MRIDENREIDGNKPDTSGEIQSDIRAGRKRLLPIGEAALYLGLEPRTIYNQIGPRAKKKFPVKCKRIGRKILFDIRDLDAYVDSLGAE